MNAPAARMHVSKHAVVETALALVDSRGLSALTLRKLAAAVGAPPMSLYAHFASKEQLHDLMFDRLVQRLFPAHGGATWQQEFEAACRHARGLLLAHPHWLPLLTRTALPTSSFGFYDHMLRLMVEDGFPRGERAVEREHQLLRLAPPVRVARRRGRVDQILPHLAALAILNGTDHRTQLGQIRATITDRSPG